MVEIVKDKAVGLQDNKSVIMSSSQSNMDDIIIEHAEDSKGTSIGEPVAPRKQKNDAIAEMRSQIESTERALVEERERSALRERDLSAKINTATETLVKSENEKIIAQEAAVINRIEAANTIVENAERALEEAIDTGRPAKEQIVLQKKLAEAVYSLKGAESAKAHFDNWKEKEKNKPVVIQDDGMTPKAREWTNSHPRFNTDKQYRRAAIAAHEDAIEDGVAVDSNEYYRRINEAVSPLESNSDGTSTIARKVSGTSTAAPANHNSTEAGARGGNAATEQRTGSRTFKLDGQMRQMALQTYGKNSQFKLSDDDAYKRYAARQLEIKEKRAKGEMN